MHASTLRVLLVDDCAADRAIFRRALDLSSLDAELTETSTIAGAVPLLLESGRWDCAIVEHRLSGGTSFDVIDRTAHTRQCPIVVLTGNADEHVGLAALDAGADGYLAKADVAPRTIERAIDYAMHRHRYVRQQCGVSMPEWLWRLGLSATLILTLAAAVRTCRPW